MAKLKQFITESECTDGLKEAYTKQSDGRYKLNELSDDHSLVTAQTEVMQKRDGLQTQVDALNATVGNLEREKTELTSKAIPSGFRAVKKEVAELGEAAQTEGFTKETLSSAKTDKATLETQLSALTTEKTVDDVAKAEKLNSRFVSLAKAKGLKFEQIEEEGKKVWKVTDGENKTSVKDFLKTDAFFKDFAGTFGQSSDDNNWVDQDSGDFDADNEFDQTRAEVKANQTKVQPRDTASVITALGGVPN